MATELAVETIRSLPNYRGGERLDKGDESVWPGIIQLPLQAEILREAKQNRPLYNKKLVAPAPIYITIIPYVSSYFMKGSEFDTSKIIQFLCI